MKENKFKNCVVEYKYENNRFEVRKKIKFILHYD